MADADGIDGSISGDGSSIIAAPVARVSSE